MSDHQDMHDGEAETLAERPIHEDHGIEKEASQELKEVRANASVDARGRHVYRTLDQHHAYAEDGSELIGEEIALVDWKPDSPTWEMHEAARMHMDPVEAAEDDAAMKASAADEARAARDQAGDDVHAAQEARDAALKAQTESAAKLAADSEALRLHDVQIAEAKTRFEAAHAEVVKHDPAEAGKIPFASPEMVRQHLLDVAAAADQAVDHNALKGVVAWLARVLHQNMPLVNEPKLKPQWHDAHIDPKLMPGEIAHPEQDGMTLIEPKPKV